jgi:hypothetical protein
MYYVHPASIKGFAEQADNGDLCPSDYAFFSTKIAARNYAAELADAPDAPYTVTFHMSGWRRIQDRQSARMRTGEIYATPWVANMPYELIRHYAHLRFDTPGLVFYFESAEKAYLDRPTSTKPGRYLEKFNAQTGGYWSASQIADWVQSIAADTLELQITSDASEIARIYSSKTTGFTSCMQSKESIEYDWQKHLQNGIAPHPAVVYAGPDLAVAYRGDLDSVKQRAIVWPERKTYQRIYGDGPLGALLARAGYTLDGIIDARIHKIPHALGGLLMPYIDGCGLAEDDPDPRYLKLSNRGPYYTQKTNGRTEDEDTETYTCRACGDTFYEDDDAWANGHNGQCEACSDNTWSCAHCGGCDTEGDSHYSVADDTWCRECYHDALQTCQTNGCGRQWIEIDLYDSEQQQYRRDHDVTGYCTHHAEIIIAAREDDTDTDTPEDTNVSPF